MALRIRFAVVAVALFTVGLVGSRAGAQGQPQPGHEMAPDPRTQPRPPGAGPAAGTHAAPPRLQPLQRPHGDAPAPHGGAEHGGQAEHAGPAEHGGHAEHDPKAPPPPINWWHGLVGEKKGVAPSLLWREPGEPPPFLASLLNFGLLVFIVVKFGKKPLQDALVKRKDSIVRELEEAKRLRESAEKRLAEYETKLDKIHEDLERIRGEFRQQGELDKQRILGEAKERRDRMKRDAEVLLSQEVKQMRQELVVEVVREATRLATELLGKEMTLGDHDRFAEMFLAELRSGSKLRGFGAVAASAAAKGSAS
jgi:F-type H+-transporting ATPase subunit b